MNNLAETVDIMLSTDYRDRFVAEYYQLKIRLDKLNAMVEKWDNGKLDFVPTCPRSIYDIQLDAMTRYKAVLEARASIESVDIV